MGDRPLVGETMIPMPIALLAKREKTRARKLIELQHALTNLRYFTRVARRFNIKEPYPDKTSKR